MPIYTGSVLPEDPHIPSGTPLWKDMCTRTHIARTAGKTGGGLVTYFAFFLFRYKAVWLIFFVLGLGTLLPWNFFMTATQVRLGMGRHWVPEDVSPRL